MKKELKVLSLILLSILLIGQISAGEKYSLKVTNEHPFLVSRESFVVSGSATNNKLLATNQIWVPASELRVGDRLTTVDGKVARVTKITDVVLDSPVLVYNLEAGNYNNFVTSGGVVVHNSNPSANEIYSFNWGTSSSKIGGLEGMVESFEIDAPPQGLQKMVQNYFNRHFGELGKKPTLEQLREAANQFELDMKHNLPFLGEPNYVAFCAIPDRNARFSNYLEMLKTYKPKLSELGCSRQLDCAGQALTIRQSLGGSNSGWELYRDYIWKEGQKVERIHVFLAKKFKTSSGDYYAIVDSTESGNKPSIMKSSDFVSMDYPRVGLKK